MLLQHGVENRDEPILEFAVVVVWYNEVPNTIEAPSSKIRAIHMEIGEVCFPKTLDEIFFYSPCGRDDR